jgi:iron complex outermembrane recepter protein
MSQEKLYRHSIAGFEAAALYSVRHGIQDGIVNKADGGDSRTAMIIGSRMTMKSPSKSATRGALLATATLMTIAMMPNAALAQQAGTPAADDKDITKSDDIIVIGTRRTDRTLTDSASPVDVISAVELSAQPSANQLDALKNIIPSFYVGQNTISDASTFVRSPSLRGLPGDEILVMLNGKRYNRSALVQVYSGGDTGLGFGSQGPDISAIPAIAIKSLQVLREGATAQYGSDAIAGVLNYGLKDNRKGLELEGRYGQFYRGDGRGIQIAGNFGLALGERGFMNVSAEYTNDGQTSRGAQRPIALQFAAANPTLANQLPNYPGPVQIWGSSPSKGYKIVFNSAYDVTDNAKVYLFANFAHSNANQSFNYRSPIAGTAVDSNGVTRNINSNGSFRNTFYLTPCPAATPTCPAGGFVQDANTFRFASIYPAGFTPRFIGVTDEAYGVVGVKGTLESGVTYDLSASTSRNSLGLSMTNSLNASYGPQSQRSFFFGNVIQKETDANADFTYPWDVGFASPITVSLGAEFRRENYTATAGDAQSYGVGPYAVAQNLYSLVSPGVYAAAGTTNAQSPGASGYGGTSPSSAGSYSQTSFAGYFGAEADVTKKLSVGVAWRYETYNTFGGTIVGKINALYKIADTFSVRGTIGSGFHAPSPGQQNVEILTTNFRSGNQVQTGTYPVRSSIAQFYGARALRPERSVNFGVGFIAKPVDRLTVTVDAYSITVTNRIGISQTYSVTAANLIAQPSLISVGLGGDVNYFTNAFNTVTQGVDVVATYRANLGVSRLNFTLAYNYNRSRATSFDPAVISADQRRTITRLAPNHRGNVNVNWSSGPFSINARENYYGSWESPLDYRGQVFGSKFVTDLDFSYSANEHFTFTVGANNLFNTFPDRIKQSATNNVYPITGSLADGQVYPRSGGPFGINGGFWYARVRIKY